MIVPFGNNNFGTVRRSHYAGPDTDSSDFSNVRVDLDDVTDLDWTLEKQYQSANKVIDHGLQPESDSDGKCSSQNGDL
jgi:hypothetical protein